MNRSTAAALVLAVLGLNSASQGVVYNYLDTTFVNADWNGVKFADTSTPTATFTAGIASPGGSTLGPSTPDYRAISHNFGGVGAGAINVTHQGNLFNWSPVGAEAALTVDYTYDVRFFDTTPGQTFGAVGFSPAIFQGGAVYRLTGYDNVFGATNWTRFTGTAIPISAFIKMDPTTAGLAAGTPNPIAPMSFGFVSANSANQYVRKDSGMDNFGMTLNTTPEPATLAALSIAATLLRRRRNG